MIPQGTFKTYNRRMVVESVYVLDTKQTISLPQVLILFMLFILSTERWQQAS